MKRRMIIVDIETSGLDPKIHGILSIGAVDFENAENKFYGECRLKEGAKVDLKALEVNGFTGEQIKNCPKSCEELMKEFLDWTKTIPDRTLAGHNVAFDTGFLKENCKEFGLEWSFGHRYVDSHSGFYLYMRSKGLEIPMKDGRAVVGMDFILNTLKLKKRDKHNALEDAQLTAEIFKKILKN